MKLHQNRKVGFHRFPLSTEESVCVWSSGTVQDSSALSPASANVFVSLGKILCLDCFVDMSVIR